ncbi:delta-12 fatty acid desaturase protein [Mycena rebaudengoi]|nr:delta-12 fatty acid desaturase protein [Mycena rebaudengoi]
MVASIEPTKMERVEQVEVTIPTLSMKDLLSSIPPHCFERSTIRSMMYPIWDFFVIGSLWKLTSIADSYTATLSSTTRTLASFSLWSLYGFFAGLFGMGLWIVAHEAGHGAVQSLRKLSTTASVGCCTSGLGVPYHSWRISHAKHHAATGHMTQDQVFVPWTRSQFGLPPLDPANDDILWRECVRGNPKRVPGGLQVILPSPSLSNASFTLCAAGLPSYLLFNTAGQPRYPKGTNHFSPSSIIYARNQRSQIVMSDLGIFLWLGLIVLACYHYSFTTVLRVYLVPYLWVNHWLVLITFLQHSDPLVPHYRSEMFNFQRGALCTLDRSLLGDLGPIMGWLGAHATHGISETHVLHHVTSKIPHYHAWEATYALRKRLAAAGINLVGRPGGWAEVYRVMRECRFVEDEGSVVFYKNARGLAAAKPVFRNALSDVEDSGVEIDK